MIKLSHNIKPHNIKRLGQAALFVLCLANTPFSIAASDFAQGLSHADYNCMADYQSGKSQAAATAQAQHGGKVLSVSTVKKDGQVVYKVKLLLDSGRIKIVSIRGR